MQRQDLVVEAKRNLANLRLDLRHSRNGVSELDVMLAEAAQEIDARNAPPKLVPSSAAVNGNLHRFECALHRVEESFDSDVKSQQFKKAHFDARHSGHEIR